MDGGDTRSCVKGPDAVTGDILTTESAPRSLQPEEEPADPP